MSDRPDYQAFYDSFEATTLSGSLSGDLGTGINACVECCDRHVGASRVALQWASASGERAEFTFEDLEERSAQVANLLVEHGVEPGQCVSGLLPRVPELVALILGVFRAGAVYQPFQGLTLETQRFPDSPNHGHFPSAVLRPGQVYDHQMAFSFSVE